jgi:Mrp family chromosome partitioning ATPase
LFNNPFGTFAESLRMLRSETSKSAKLDGSAMDPRTGIADVQTRTSRVICVTSSVPKEGKSTTSLALAVVSAMSGQRTCLVDFDFRRPSLSDYTGLETNPELAAYFQGQSDGFSIQSLDYDFGSGDLDIITGAPGGRINADQAISSGQLKVLINDLRREYDYVVIDTAPVLAVAETQFIAQYSDQSVYCVRENYAARGVIDQSFEKMRSAVGDQSALTIAFTMSTSGKNRYYYAYKSYAESS